MNQGETAKLAEAIHAIRGMANCGVLVIDHDLRFIMDLSDRIYVLHEGRVLCEGAPALVQADANVQEIYLGRSRAEG
jgi:branched-chain amino acid transport system ATP-binding protein